MTNQAKRTQAIFQQAVTQTQPRMKRRPLTEILNPRFYFNHCWQFILNCLYSITTLFKSVPNKPVQPAQPGKALIGEQPAHKKGKKTLVLDLDETLIHSNFEIVPEYDIKLQIVFQQTPITIYVRKRPGVDAFLETMSKYYEIVIFTASVKDYAQPLIAELDKGNYIDHQIYRDGCTPHNGSLVKDLTKIGRDMKDLLIVDNAVVSFAFQPGNAIHIKDFYNDAHDEELAKWTAFLIHLSEVEDVRPIPSRRAKFDMDESMSTTASVLDESFSQSNEMTPLKKLDVVKNEKIIKIISNEPDSSLKKEASANPAKFESRHREDHAANEVEP